MRKTFLTTLLFIVMCSLPASGQDVTAQTIQAAINALPPTGGTVVLPQGVTTVSSTITINAPVNLVGQGSGLDGQGTIIRWTGGASALFSVSSFNGLALRNFSIDNSGTGTIAIDIDNGGANSNSILLEDIFCVSPTVAFSDSFIRIGNNSGTSPPVDIRINRVYALKAAAVSLKAMRGNHIVFEQSRFVQNISNDAVIGTTTQVVVAFHASESTFEDAKNTTSVSVINAEVVSFDQCYFESDGTGWAIDIPSSAHEAQTVSVANSRFIGQAWGDSTPQAIEVNFSSATVNVENTYFLRYASGAVHDASSSRISYRGVSTDSTGSCLADMYQTVSEYSQSNCGGSVIGSRVVSLLINDDAVMTASPRPTTTVFLPGTLTSTWTGGTWTLDKAITVTRIQVQVKTAPTTCSTNAVVRLTDGTTPQTVTVSAAANSSGALTQNYAGAAVLTIGVSTAAVGCGTNPSDANVIVQYRMQ